MAAGLQLLDLERGGALTPALLVDPAEEAAARLPGRIEKAEGGPAEPRLRSGSKGDAGKRRHVNNAALAGALAARFSTGGRPGASGRGAGAARTTAAAGAAGSPFFSGWRRRRSVFLLIRDRARAGRGDSFKFCGGAEEGRRCDEDGPRQS